MRYMDVAELRNLGYLQEVNRRFFHPLGLALEINLEQESGIGFISGIQDYRDDPEGIVFEDIDPTKAAYIDNEMAKRREARERLQGSAIQPVPEAE